MAYDMHERVCELEAEVSRLRASLEDTLKQKALADAKADFAEEHILYRVCDWLHAVGKPQLAQRIDPRQGDTIRKHLARQAQHLADDINKTLKDAKK